MFNTLIIASLVRRSGSMAGLAALSIMAACGLRAAETPETIRSPVNQVFQFMQSGTCAAWSDGSKTNATAYLWIPENCKKLRGLVIMCTNVPEHMLVGHPAVRASCEANDLGILWSVPSFMNLRKTTTADGNILNMATENKTTVAFLRQLLDGLAGTSGYDEVATVPWLPMGESGHMAMVDALVEECPRRCIAGIWIKNSHLPPSNRQTPALVAFGTAQEWSQDKGDIRTKWNNIGKTYEGILNQRKSNPNWPLSYIIDGSSGHFDCSDRLAKYFARYIDLAAKARLSDDGSPALKPVALDKGFLADLPVPGHENKPVTAFAAAAPEARALPWYFDKDTAEEARSIAAINWKAKTQLPGFLDDKGQVLPFSFNGITDLDLKTMTMAPDGITFTVRGTMLDRIPPGFVGAGEKLAQSPGVPEVEWLCGPVAPLGGGRFRVALDRAWLGGGAAYLALRKNGTDAIRGVVQPARIDFRQIRNFEGRPQTITFTKIADVTAGADAIPLVAKSDANLPVEFFVIAGPAIVKDGRLVFTGIPPRARFPVEVTVAAWQWGRNADPKVKTAETVRQTFQILPPGK